MAKRRTKKQKIRAQKYRLKKEKKVEKVERAEKVEKAEAEPKQEAGGEKNLIIKDLLKTVWISLALLGLLVLIYWLEIRTA